MGEAKQKAADQVTASEWAGRVGRAIGNWFIILTVIFWGGFLIFGAFFHQLIDGPRARQRAFDTMTGRQRFLE